MNCVNGNCVVTLTGSLLYIGLRVMCSGVGQVPSPPFIRCVDRAIMQKLGDKSPPVLDPTGWGHGDKP